MQQRHLELLTQIKAFRNYLDSFTKNSDKSANNDENSREFIVKHIKSRYSSLKQALYNKDSRIFSGLISSGDIENGLDIQYLLLEIEYAMEVFEKLYCSDEDNKSSQQNFKANNQPFTKDEIQLINNQLDDLQTKLIENLNSQKLPQEKLTPLIESVKNEISDLKAETANDKLGRKDWKNHLVNTMITLTFTLSFSPEARNTIFIYFQSLFIYLQQNIFLLKP
jgi:hypothetical protein